MLKNQGLFWHGFNFVTRCYSYCHWNAASEVGAANACRLDTRMAQRLLPVQTTYACSRQIKDSDTCSINCQQLQALASWLIPHYWLRGSRWEIAQNNSPTPNTLLSFSQSVSSILSLRLLAGERGGRRTFHFIDHIRGHTGPPFLPCDHNHVAQKY